MRAPGRGRATASGARAVRASLHRASLHPWWSRLQPSSPLARRYQRSGTAGPAVLLVHGFGGNCDHWRKNTGVVGEWGRAYSIDLLGYGYSAKPSPRVGGNRTPNQVYNFEEWARASLMWGFCLRAASCVPLQSSPSLRPTATCLP